MALATKCPYCQTTFRVAHDQLKLRAGLVRCGSCKQIFNGVENLLGPERSPQASGTSKPPSPSARQNLSGTSGTAPKQAPSRAAERQAQPAPVQAMPLGKPAAPLQPVTNVRNQQARPVVAGTLPSPPAGEAAPRPARAAAGADTQSVPRPQQPSEQQTVTGVQQATARQTVARPQPTTPVPDTGDNVTDPVASDDIDVNPLTRMTLMDFTAFDEPDLSSESQREDTAAAIMAGSSAPLPLSAARSSGTDELERAMTDLERRPWRGARKTPATPGEQEQEYESEVDFVRKALRKQRIDNALHWLSIVGSIILVPLLIFQSMYAFRDQLAARVPALAPWLGQACEVIGCQIGLPQQIETISLESHELRAVSPDSGIFQLSVLLRNQATVMQSWPSIELTLNDANEKPIARRVFAPAEYLSGKQQVAAGFPPASEQAIKVHFQLTGLTASGFRVYLFYP